MEIYKRTVKNHDDDSSKLTLSTPVFIQLKKFSAGVLPCKVYMSWLTVHVCMGFANVVTFVVQQMMLIVSLETSFCNACRMVKEYSIGKWR
jgi:hypothetical protein